MQSYFAPVAKRTSAADNGPTLMETFGSAKSGGTFHVSFGSSNGSRPWGCVHASPRRLRYSAYARNILNFAGSNPLARISSLATEFAAAQRCATGLYFFHASLSVRSLLFRPRFAAFSPIITRFRD